MNQAAEQQAMYDRFDLRKYLLPFYRQRVFILSFMTLTAGIAIFYLWRATPQYRIQAAVVIKDEKKGEAVSNTLKELDFLDDQKIVDNEAEIIKSERIIAKVVQDMSLHINYYRKINVLKQEPLFENSPIRLTIIHPSKKLLENKLKLSVVDTNSFTLAGDGKKHSFGDTVKNNDALLLFHQSETIPVIPGEELRVRVFSVDEVTQNIRNSLSVLPPTKNSSILNIVTLHASRIKGEAILSAIISEYNRINILEKQTQTDTILHLIEDRIALISGQLNNYEKAAELFKAKQGITELSEDAKMYLASIQNNDQDLAEATTKYTLLTDIENYVKQSNASLAPPPVGNNDPSLINNISQLNLLEMEKKNLEITTGKENPVLRIKTQQINNIRASILQNLSLQKESAGKKIKELSSVNQSIKNSIGSVPGKERNLLEMMREKTIRENIYTYLLQKREEASIRDVSLFQKMRVIDSPYSSSQPVRPNKPIIFSGALFLGFLLPVFGITIRRSLNNRILSRKQIEDLSDIKVLGEIARTNRFAYIAFEEQPTIIAEQFRQLRSSLQASNPSPSPRIFLVSSAVPGEGKSFTCINLAISYSLLGAKTLLIDADLRNPRLGKIFGFEESRLFNDYLHRKHTDIHSAIKKHPDFPNLDVIGSSIESQEASELLGRDLSALFDTLKLEYDYIFINTPPFRIFSDGVQLEKYADIILFVVRHNYSKETSLSAIQERKPDGIIYNDVPVTELFESNLIKGKQFKYQ